MQPILGEKSRHLNLTSVCRMRWCRLGKQKLHVVPSFPHFFSSNIIVHNSSSQPAVWKQKFKTEIDRYSKQKKTKQESATDQNAQCAKYPPQHTNRFKVRPREPREHVPKIAFKFKQSLTPCLGQNANYLVVLG